jgi:hypothetical protein
MGKIAATPTHGESVLAIFGKVSAQVESGFG